MALGGEPLVQRRRLKSNDYKKYVMVCGVRVDVTGWRMYLGGTFLLLMFAVYSLEDDALWRAAYDKDVASVPKLETVASSSGALLRGEDRKACVEGLVWCEGAGTCVLRALYEQGIFDCAGPSKSAADTLVDVPIVEMTSSDADEEAVQVEDIMFNENEVASEEIIDEESDAVDGDLYVNDNSINVDAAQLAVADRPPLDATKAVGNREVGGLYDGNVVQLYQQISAPPGAKTLNYQNTRAELTNFYPLKTYLKRRGWSYANKAPRSKIAMFFSRGASPASMIPGRQMANSIGYSGCIGGSKTLQLKCRKKLAEAYGCKFDQLGVQPAQYSMLSEEECQEWYKDASKPQNKDKMWILKPSYTFHGAGIQVHKGISVIGPKYGGCKKSTPLIIMDYIDNPATIGGGYKFDLRSYLLVGSLKPQLVFYHDGFARKADTKYSKDSNNRNIHVTNAVSQSGKDHFWTFEMLSEALHKEHGFPADFLAQQRAYMEKVTKFLFMTTKTQDNPLRHNTGRYQLFAIDWMISLDRKLHVLEGNGYPLVTNYASMPDFSPKIWDEMMELVLNIHMEPEKLPADLTVKAGFRHGGWSLVYNELEDEWARAAGKDLDFDACKQFSKN